MLYCVLLLLWRKIRLSPVKCEQWKKMCLSVLMSEFQRQIKLSVSKKLAMLELTLFKWHSLIRSPLALYGILPGGLIKDRILFLNTLKRRWVWCEYQTFFIWLSLMEKNLKSFTLKKITKFYYSDCIDCTLSYKRKLSHGDIILNRSNNS